jgi:adenylate kinase
MNLVLLGPPGAGKGTQAAFLAEQCHVPKISTGEMLRQVARGGGEIGQKVADLIDRGHMVPDETVLRLVWDRLQQADAREGFLLDGFPRNIVQAEALDRFLRQTQRRLTAVVNIEVGEDEVIRRLSGRRVCSRCKANYHLVSYPPQTPGRCDHDGAPLERRPDDEPEAIRERLDLYHQRTEPVLGYYRAQGLLHSIDGEQAMGVVTRQILGVMADRS